MKHHLLILISLLLLSSPVIGQSINCSKEKIKKMIDLGWSDNEIKQVCGKYTKPSKPEKEKSLKNVKNPKRILPQRNTHNLRKSLQ